MTRGLDMTRHYDASERLAIDYSKIYKSLNHYASDELQRLPTTVKEDLLNLSPARRQTIYESMNKTFSEAAVDEAGGWPQFMAKSEHAVLGNLAQNLVKGTVETAKIMEAPEAPCRQMLMSSLARCKKL